MPVGLSACSVGELPEAERVRGRGKVEVLLVEEDYRE